MVADKTVTVGRELLEQVTRELSDYSVGFVRLVKNDSMVDGELAGSGTLVCRNECYAVLTADHVLENLPSSGKLGLVLPTRFEPQLHRVILDMEYAQKVRIGRGSTESEGPDIGVLLLPMPTVSTIKANKSFYNLQKTKEEEQDYIEIEYGIWLICGLAHEWTTDAEPERGYERVKIFRGTCGAGKVGNERTIGEFDYLDFDTKYDHDYEGPQSYGGFSGGGLWQIVIGKDSDGVLLIKKKILSGVIFYQSDLNDRRRTIVCHGRDSVYRAVIDVLDNAS